VMLGGKIAGSIAHGFHTGAIAPSQELSNCRPAHQYVLDHIDRPPGPGSKRAQMARGRRWGSLYSTPRDTEKRQLTGPPFGLQQTIGCHPAQDCFNGGERSTYSVNRRTRGSRTKWATHAAVDYRAPSRGGWDTRARREAIYSSPPSIPRLRP